MLYLLHASPDRTLKEQIVQSTPQMAWSSKLVIVPPPHTNAVKSMDCSSSPEDASFGSALPTEPLFIVKCLRREAQAGDSVSDSDTASGFDQTMPRPARSWSCSWNQGSTEPEFESRGWVPCGDKNWGFSPPPQVSASGLLGEDFEIRTTWF